MEGIGLSSFERALCRLQGILGVFMREPLLEWQREGRLLKDASVGASQAATGAEDVHIAAKACAPSQAAHPNSCIGTVMKRAALRSRKIAAG